MHFSLLSARIDVFHVHRDNRLHGLPQVRTGDALANIAATTEAAERVLTLLKGSLARWLRLGEISPLLQLWPFHARPWVSDLL